VTVRERGLRAARRAARDLLRRWGVRTAADIRVEAIAKAEGIRIVEGPLRGARGRLVSGPQPVIRIADDTIEDGARRFTIAHEIGHHVLNHPCGGTHGACASARASTALDASWRDYEAEANAFASELLMPRHLVVPHCDGEPSLEIPRAIALEFGTSIPASAIRYVQLTGARCAAVYSQRGTIEWAPRSRGFKATLARGAPVPLRSFAHACTRGQDHDDRALSLNAAVWFSTDKHNVEIVEHSAPLSDTGAVITLLWVPEIAASKLWA
jgi:Zn-dependent peptidase ImmA (M78 family)